MFDETDEIAFVIWTADTGNASRAEWGLSAQKDRWERMARAAIQRMRVLDIVPPRQRPSFEIVKN